MFLWKNFGESERVKTNVLENQNYSSLDLEKRIEYILTDVYSREAFENFLRGKRNTLDSQKSVEKAQEFLVEGNEYFAEEDVENAIEEYTEAILCAPHEVGENSVLYKSYLKRSEAFMVNEQYEECRHDISQALILNSSVDLEQRFVDLSYSIPAEKECKKLILGFDERFDIRKSEQKGRHIITKSPICEGEIVLTEKPNVIALTFDMLLLYCSHCYRSIGINPLQCTECNECVFCDENCAEKAINGFHRYECGITYYISKYFNDQFLLAYRIMTNTGIGDVKDLYELYAQTEGVITVEEWIKGRNYHALREYDASERLAEFMTILSLVDNSEHYAIDKELKEIFMAIEMAFLIHEIGVYDLTDNQDFIRFTAMLLRISRKVEFNAFSWDINKKQIGVCLCFVSAMFNHSCDPNIYWGIIKGEMAMIAIQDIGKNSEVNDSYGYVSEPFLERQRELRENYYFTCSCTLCREQQREYIVFKCQKCNGSVFFEERLRNDLCIDCGQKLNDIDLVLNEFIISNNSFDNRIHNIHHNINVEESLFIAGQCLQELTRILSSTSIDLEEINAEYADGKRSVKKNYEISE